MARRGRSMGKAAKWASRLGRVVIDQTEPGLRPRRQGGGEPPGHADELLGRQGAGAPVPWEPAPGAEPGAGVVFGAGAGAVGVAEVEPAGALRGEDSADLVEHGDESVDVVLHG